jgi:hypothetical protein
VGLAIEVEIIVKLGEDDVGDDDEQLPKDLHF